MKGGPKFINLAPGPPLHPTWGNFVIREMGHVNIYLCTKFQVSGFTRSHFTSGRIQKLINSAHGPPPRPLLGYFSIHKMGLAKVYPWFRVPNLKFLSLPVSNLWISLRYIQQTRLLLGHFGTKLYCRSVRTPVPKCLGAEVSIHHSSPCGRGTLWLQENDVTHPSGLYAVLVLPSSVET